MDYGITKNIRPINVFGRFASYLYDIIKILNDAGISNANLLLNIGPKGEGSLPYEGACALKEAGKKRRRNISI